MRKSDVLKVKDKHVVARINDRIKILRINRVHISNSKDLDSLCKSCVLEDESEITPCVITDYLGFCYLCDVVYEVSNLYTGCYFTENTSLILASKYRNDRME